MECRLFRGWCCGISTLSWYVATVNWYFDYRFWYFNARNGGFSLIRFKWQSGIALGNAYGSNITNIALILGLTALIKPLTVHGSVIKKELPILLIVTVLSAYFLFDMRIARLEAIVLLALFIGYVVWTIWSSKKQRASVQANYEEDKHETCLSFKAALFWLIVGLALLMVSSQLLIWEQ